MNKTEYRYAGSEPNNYVRFNNEIWRIIGLVNVKVGSSVEQRIKIVRSDGISGQKDFGDYAWDINGNNWTTSKLKDMLNGIYYESGKGDCYNETKDAEVLLNTCDFSGNGKEPKGLDEKSRNMIDKEVTWNIGAVSIYDNVLPENSYNYERQTEVYDNNPSEWNKTTNVGNKFNGIGLIYPSDYGYAVGGDVRSTCLETAVSTWNNIECNTSNWLTPSNYYWTISPASVARVINFVRKDGHVGNHYINYCRGILPTLYLKSSVKILPNPNKEEYGTINNPFNLE